MRDLKPMMLRLPPELDKRLSDQAEDMMIPKAALARVLIRQQLDHWDEMSEQEQVHAMRASDEARRARHRSSKKKRRK